MGKLKFPGKKGGGGWAPPPEGTFDLQITEVRDDETTKDGLPQVVLTVAIADGPEEGKDFRQYFTMDEENSWRLLRVADACGVDYVSEEGDDGDIVDMEIDTDDLLLCYFRATIKHHKSGDKTYVNLRDEQPSKLSGSADDEDDADDDEGAEEDPPEPEEEPKPKAKRRRRRATA